MNELRIGTLQASFAPGALQDRALAINAAVAELNAARSAHAERLATVREVRPTSYAGDVPLNGSASWIGPHTFADPDAALACVSELQRNRVALPLRGLALLGDIEAVRDETQAAWTAHAAGLAEALAQAEAKARTEAAKLPVSEALKNAHVGEVTARLRTEAAAANPCQPDWPRWKTGAIRAAREALLEELREAFAGALRC